MPRPRKWRRVCRLPQNTLFGPLAGIDDGTIVMTVEEYETIRLIDLEGLNQEACADARRTDHRASHVPERAS